ARARLVRDKLIIPACNDASFKPLLDGQAPNSLMTPLVSPLAGEPLAIIDLGPQPWDGDLLIDIGFMPPSHRHMAVLVDKPLVKENLPRNSRHLVGGCVLEIDARRPADSRRALAALLSTAAGSKSLFWSSQYAFVDMRINWSDPSQTTYTYANEPAA